MFRFIKAICFICFAKTNGFLGNLTANVVIRQYSSDITPGIEKRRQNAKKMATETILPMPYYY
jgi:hypothetical protein